MLKGALCWRTQSGRSLGAADIQTASMERFEAEEAAWEIDRMVKSQNSPSWEGSAVC